MAESGQLVKSSASEDKRGELHLVVVIPALNEEITVGDTVRRIPRSMNGVGMIEALVVNDGSTDETPVRAVEAGAKVVSHDQPQGFGAAFQTGLARALDMGADLVVTIDADGQFYPETIPLLIAPVVSGKADFATASRFLDPTLTPKMPRAKLWGNKMMSRLISGLIGRRYYDVSCGMRCYSKRAAMSLNSIGSFTHSQEDFLSLAFKRLRIVEVPIKVEGQRKHGKSRIASNLFKYAVNSSWIIFRCYRDYRPMRFFGWLALGFVVPAGALEAFLLYHYLATGGFSPHKWAGFTGAALFAFGTVLLALGLIGDMLNRHRMYLEELLYYRRMQSAENRPVEGDRQHGPRG